MKLSRIHAIVLAGAAFGGMVWSECGFIYSAIISAILYYIVIDD